MRRRLHPLTALIVLLACLAGGVGCGSCTKSEATLVRESWDELAVELPKLNKREQLRRLEQWLVEHSPNKKWTFGVHHRRSHHQANIRIKALRSELQLDAPPSSRQGQP